MLDKKVTILGGGLVGSLMAVFLAKRGYDVTVFEKRGDPRQERSLGGRSINLALSDRGLLALQKAGIGAALDRVMVPMKGRMIHQINLPNSFQPYGKSNQAINSVSRELLNELLISEAENVGVRFMFGHKCEAVDIDACIATFEAKGGLFTQEADLILGADGAYSTLRTALQRSDRFSYSQEYIPHGYKELNIAPGKDGDFQLEPHALHIWPRGQFMLIALPNTDKSFTCTLFLPFEGKLSFASLDTPGRIQGFFKDLFPDMIGLIPDIKEQFFANPTSSLVTVHCHPWSKKRCLLIGDAAHAVVPFYGQGMNAGFEDCRLFINMLDQNPSSWEALVSDFGSSRKKDTDAIARLALDNFIEMRDKVSDPGFLWQKKLEARLHDRYPEKWIPLYTMVTFSHMPYHEALEVGQRQESIMRKIREVYPMSTPPEAIDLEKIVDMLDKN